MRQILSPPGKQADFRYEWLNKKHRVSSSASKFSRFAEAPGTFSVKSVALKENDVGAQDHEMAGANG